MANRQCSLCDRTTRTHTIYKESGLCTACDMALRYWQNKTPRQMLKRQRQVQSFQNRMDTLLGNVKSLPAKKRRRA